MQLPTLEDDLGIDPLGDPALLDAVDPSFASDYLTCLVNSIYRSRARFACHLSSKSFYREVGRDWDVATHDVEELLAKEDGLCEC